MSKYHANCNKSEDRLPNKTRPGPSLTSKPFCDCGACTCKNCPDILKMLSITVTDTTCDFGSKAACKEKTCTKSSEHDELVRDSLLDVLNEDRDCSCEVVARAVRSDVHMNLGLAQRRGAHFQPDRRTSTSSETHDK